MALACSRTTSRPSGRINHTGFRCTNPLTSSRRRCGIWSPNFSRNTMRGKHTIMTLRRLAKQVQCRNERSFMLIDLFSTDSDWTLTMLRIVLGLVFFAHGAQKLLGWFGGPGLKQTMRAMHEHLGL